MQSLVCRGQRSTFMSWLSFHHELLELNSGFHAWWQALLLAGPFCQPLKARALKENSCWIERGPVRSWACFFWVYPHRLGNQIDITMLIKIILKSYQSDQTIWFFPLTGYIFLRPQFSWEWSKLIKIHGKQYSTPQSELLILLLLHSAFPVSPGPSIKSTSSCLQLSLLDWQSSENSPIWWSLFKKKNPISAHKWDN